MRHPQTTRSLQTSTCAPLSPREVRTLRTRTPAQRPRAPPYSVFARMPYALLSPCHVKHGVIPPHSIPSHRVCSPVLNWNESPAREGAQWCKTYTLRPDWKSESFAEDGQRGREKSLAT